MVTRTDLEIARTIDKLNKQIESKKFHRMKQEIKDGIRECVRVLKERDEELEHIRDNCEFVRSRFIAWLAVDYLQGKREADEILLVYRIGR